MKTAILISGNLRTFLMPTRENPNERLCDTFVRNVLNKNDANVFIFTDTNDFYYNGTQYYSTDKEVEILNDNSFRIYYKINFISNDDSKNIISSELNKLVPDQKLGEAFSIEESMTQEALALKQE